MRANPPITNFSVAIPHISGGATAPFTAAISVLLLDSQVDVGLSQNALAGDTVLVWAVCDPNVPAGNSGTPAGGNAVLVATLVGGGSAANAAIPDLALTGWLVFQRTVDSGQVLTVEVSGMAVSDSQQRATLSPVTAPSGTAHTAALALSLVPGVVSLGLSYTATGADSVRVWWISDPTVAAGAGAPPNGTQLGDLVGGAATANLQIPPSTSPGWISFQRLGGATAIKIFITSGAGADSSGGGGTGVVPPTPSTLVERGTLGQIFATFAVLAAAAASVASAGLVRTASSAQGLVRAKSVGGAGDGDVHVLDLDGADGLVLGDVTNAVSILSKVQAGGLYEWFEGANTPLIINGAFSAILFGYAFVGWGGDVVAPHVQQLQKSGNGANAGQPLEIAAQQGQAQTGGAANNNGGDVLLVGGVAGTGGGGAAGKQGNLAVHALPASWNGGERIMFVANAPTAPSGDPTAGAYIYTASGMLTVRGAGGLALATDGSGLGFFGKATTPQAQVTAYTLTYAAAASRTLSDYTNTPTGIDNTQVGSPYAQNADLLLASAQIKDLSAVVKQILTDLKGYGLTA